MKGAIQGREAIVGPLTVIEKEQLNPPNEIAKLAIPLEVGVPEMT